MTDEELAELYYRTTLELADAEGVVWGITPTEGPGMSPVHVLVPFSHAFILTAENPESAGAYTPEQNAKATKALRADIAARGIPHRPCPGYGFDVAHVEHGFALLATDDTSSEVRAIALELAHSYRQNAIFHLSAAGLGIIGALRSEMSAVRPVRLSRAEGRPASH